MIFIILPVLFVCMAYSELKKRIADPVRAVAVTIIVFEAVTVLAVNLLSIGGHLTSLTASLFWLFLDMLLLRFILPAERAVEVTETGRTGKSDKARSRNAAHITDSKKKNNKNNDASPDVVKNSVLLSTVLFMVKSVKEGLSDFWHRVKDCFGRAGFLEKLLMGLCLIFSLVLFFLALFNVPYNYDSMTYHLARIGYWIDHGSVGYYVTNIDRQLFSPVLSEYNLLFMMLLTGSDTLLNLQQFIEMLVCAYFIFHILKKLCARDLFAWLAVFMYLSMPLTISQAITTQNDIGTLMWYEIFVFYMIEFIRLPVLRVRLPKVRSAGIKANDNAFLLVLCIGFTVGFSFLMKVSVCASMIWFLPWVAVCCIKRRDRISELIKAAAVAAVSLVLVIAETLIRTYRWTGSFFSASTSGDIMVATKNVSYIIVNILKNYSLLITQHILTGLNGVIYRFAIAVGRILNVEVNNDAIAFHHLDFITWLNMGDDMYSHDRTPSAFAAYIALIGAVLLMIAVIRKAFCLVLAAFRKDNKDAGIKTENDKTDIKRVSSNETKKDCGIPFSYGFVISSWLGFGFIMALLRWQPWGSRLMYPALTMAAVSAIYIIDRVAKVLCRFFGKGTEGGNVKTPDGKYSIDYFGVVIAGLLALISFILSVKPVVYNSQVAMDYVSSGFDSEKRGELMFTSHSHLYEGYNDLMKMIEKTGAEDIGLCISGDGYDYPLWKMLRESVPEARLRHIIADEDNMKAISQEPSRLAGRISGGPDLILWIELKEIHEGDHFDCFGDVYTCGFISQAEGAQCYILFPDKTVNRPKQTISGG